MHQPITETVPAYQPPPHWLKRLGRRMMSLLVLASLLWALAILLIWHFQEKLLFHPEPSSATATFKLDHTSEVFIDVQGAKLHALYLRQPPEKSKGIVLFLHGNAGNLETWFTNAEFWLATGYDVLMPDYRGYGKSTGKITSEEQLHDDVMKAWQFVAANYPTKKVVFYGRSLGTDLAAKLASQVKCDLLVLVSPYESMKSLAREFYPWVPSFVLRYPLNTQADIQPLNTPILLLHGDQDKLISLEHSKRLITQNRHAKLVVITGAGHGDIHNFDLYTDTLKSALQEL